MTWRNEPREAAVGPTGAHRAPGSVVAPVVLSSQCVILAGGLGTRLGALAAATPKPLLTVAGRPFLDHLIEEIARFGVDRFLILAGHLGERIASHYTGEHRAREGRAIRIDVAIEPEPLGTAGGLALFADRLDETFLLFNGDTFFDFNIADLLHPPLPKGVLMRLAVRREPRPARFGTVELAGGQGSERVVGFREKADDDKPAFVNAGAYLVRKAAVALIESRPSSLERDLMPKLVAVRALQARRYAGLSIDIGVPAELTRAQTLFPIRRPAVFFDRDGVLNEDDGYTHRPEDLRWLPGAREAIREVNDSGRFAFVITNQAGIAHGYYGEEAVCAFHEEMQRQLLQMGAHVDAFMFCPHHPEGRIAHYMRVCACRKPAPGMIEHLIHQWPVIAEESLVVGDRDSDLAAAAAAGICARRYEGGDVRRLL